MKEEFQGIDDRRLSVSIYSKEKKSINYYYIYEKDNKYIKVSGIGSDPYNLKNIMWESSKGAAGILKQILKIKSGYSPKFGFISLENYPNNIYIQIIRFKSLYKNGWRYSESNL